MDSGFNIWRSIRNLACLLITAGLHACIPEPLDVDNIPDVKPELVVLTQFVPDRSLVVMVTRTFGALDASRDSDPVALLRQIAVDDAIVEIEGPAGSYTLVPLGTGLYGDTMIPFRNGEAYTLTVTSASFGEVYATTTVQPTIAFDSLSAHLHGVSLNDSLAEITYSLNDPRGKNWYMLNVQHVEANELVEDLLGPNSFTRLVDDGDFDGHKYLETFRVFPRDFRDGDTLAISLANISEDYYNFMNVRQDNRFTFVEYLSEPVNYPSNIIGGKGFFNLYIPDVRFIVLRPWN